MALATQIEATDIPCYALDLSDYHYSAEWGNRLIEIWIENRQAFVKEGLSVEAFRENLCADILSAADIDDAFLQGCAEAGIDDDLGSDRYDAYLELHQKDVLNIVPSGLHAELCWIPDWNGGDLDSLIESHGLKSERWGSNYLEEVIPGNWLKVFLEMVNCSSTDLIGAAIAARGSDGRAFAEKCAAANFKVDRDQQRRQLLSPDQVIAAIENAHVNALPMFHFEINVRALLQLDPRQPMRLCTTKREEVHVGFHEGINGAGYMDTYKGEVVVPPTAVGFLGAKRWRWSINETYGLFRPAFYATPVAMSVHA